MRRRIYWGIFGVCISAMVLTVVLMLFSAYNLLLRQAKQDLVDEYKLVSQSVTYHDGDMAEYLSALDMKRDSLRITIISQAGDVVFDTGHDQESMENHMDRPEFQQALAGGEGEDIRHSQTMGVDFYYYAKQLPSGEILRVSKQMSSIGGVFVSVIPMVAGIVLLVLVASFPAASQLTKKLLRPVEELASQLEQPDVTVKYAELQPFFVRIKEQNRTIREQMERLKEERDTIQTIISNMKEGMILLDGERTILSVNQSARLLLGTPEGEYEGKNILLFSRDPELNQQIGLALQGEACSLLLSKNGRDVRIFISPVEKGEALYGVILLLLDVTEQERAEKIRRDFTANVSHELKTPLTSISGFAEMIENGMVQQPEDIRKFSGRIHKEAGRLISLTEDIIRLSRIEEGGAMELEPVDLLEVCRSVCNSLQFVASGRNISIQAEGEPCIVNGNAQMLEELFYNLAENAVKYNRENGSVVLKVARGAEEASVCVSDTGIGIPQEHQARIFERFYRVDKSRSKETGGTGLGLSIVKHIVERHGGRISLASTPGAGTSITVCLPLKLENGKSRA